MDEEGRKLTGAVVGVVAGGAAAYLAVVIVQSLAFPVDLLVLVAGVIVVRVIVGFIVRGMRRRNADRSD
jgi:hypothetical protein